MNKNLTLGLCAVLLLASCAAPRVAPTATAIPTISSPTPTLQATAQGAYFISQKFVSGELKAPKTAQYPDFTDPGVNVVDFGNGRWRVTAFVDSQNSFGALIRARYIAFLDWLGNNQWKLVRMDWPDSQ